MDTGMANNPSELSKLALQFGPFFFSVLFSIFIPTILHGYVGRARNPGEKKIYLRFYQITLVFGMVLVIASVIWWFVRFPYAYVFKGQICDLENYVKLSSDSLFFKPVAIPFSGEEDLVQNVEFMVVQDNPFKKGQKFRLYFKKGEGERKTLPLIFESEKDTEFAIKYVEQKNEYEIVSLTPKDNAKLSEPELSSPFPLFGGSLFAEELKTEPTSFPEPKLDFLLQAQDYGQYIGRLQDEREDVGLKIRILNDLKSLPDVSFRQIVETSTPKEPMVLTLLDLSRHSDRELAHVSDALLERFDVEAYLASKLLAADQTSRQRAEIIMFRIEKNLAEKVFSHIPSENKTPWIRRLQDEVYSRRKTRVLYPTGSNTGDRYYIFVEWDPAPQILECLAKLFAQEILFTSLEKELVFLKNESRRWVYKDNKESALRFAEEILACGARAQFAGIKSAKK